VLPVAEHQSHRSTASGCSIRSAGHTPYTCER
jgi:hypothetical protein